MFDDGAFLLRWNIYDKNYKTRGTRHVLNYFCGRWKLIGFLFCATKLRENWICFHVATWEYKVGNIDECEQTYLLVPKIKSKL